MIQALGNASGLSIDAEHLRIIQELRRLGLASSGNKEVDLSNLTLAKAELINKIKQKENVENSQSLGIQTIGAVDETENSKRNEMEIQKLGAMNIAQLNRIFFGLQ